MAFDPLGADAAVKSLQPIVDSLTNELGAIVEGAIDRVGATVITIGPITIPAFTIQVQMPSSAGEKVA
jgi:hypothetical protein